MTLMASNPWDVDRVRWNMVALSQMPDAPPSPANSEPATGTEGSVPDEMPSWFRSYVEQSEQRFSQLDGRLGQFGKDFGRLRERMRRGSDPQSVGGDPDEQPQAPRRQEPSQPAGVSREDVAAGLKLGKILGKLPETAQDRIDAMIEDGASYQEALIMAEMLVDLIPQQQPRSESPANPPTGQAASAATRHAPPRPASLEELRKLQKSDPKAYEALWEDDSFDPSKLPARVSPLHRR